MLLRSAGAGELARVLSSVRSALGDHASRRVRWAVDVDPESLS
jgi:primosomal protein N'